MKRLLIVLILLLPFLVIGCGGGGGYTVWVIFGGEVLLEDGSPLEGVELVFFWPEDESTGSDWTDEDGWYEFWINKGFTDWPFTITPSHPDYIFEPTSYSLPGAYADNLYLDFKAIPITSISQ